MPARIMNAMGIDAGDNVKVVQKTDIQKGEYIKIRPFQKAFIELSNPKAVLERHISQFYPVLTKGEVINILYNDVNYQIEIVETKPSNSIQTTNCDINLDFDRPVDMEEESKNETRQKIKQENKIIHKRSKEDMRRFPGKGYRLGSS